MVWGFVPLNRPEAFKPKASQWKAWSRSQEARPVHPGDREA